MGPKKAASKSTQPAAVKRNPTIVKLIDQSKTDDNAKIVSIWNQIRIAGKADKLVYNMTIHPKRVGVSKHNRGGFMVSGVSVHEVGEGVVNVGYDPTVHKDATCFEASEDRSSEDKFLSIVANDPYLARYEKIWNLKVLAAVTSINFLRLRKKGGRRPRQTKSLRMETVS